MVVADQPAVHPMASVAGFSGLQTRKSFRTKSRWKTKTLTRIYVLTLKYTFMKLNRLTQFERKLYILVFWYQYFSKNTITPHKQCFLYTVP